MMLLDHSPECLQHILQMWSDLATLQHVVIGAYSETNDEFQDLLKVCARMAVARGDAAVYNSPAFETEVKG